jgi:hypothetical protein
MTLQSEIFKTDVLGRVRIPAERREALLDEFERSGLSGRKFSEMVGVKYQTFASWIQNRRRDRGEYPSTTDTMGAGAAKPMQWLEAVAMAEAPEAKGLCVEFPGGASMRIADKEQAALAALMLRELAGVDRPC